MNQSYLKMSKDELKAQYDATLAEYNDIKNKGINNNEIFLSSVYWTSTMFVDIDPLYELKWDPENERYVIYNIDYLDYNCAYIFWPLKYESWPTIPVSESTSLKIEFWERSDALPIRPVKRNNTI